MKRFTAAIICFIVLGLTASALAEPIKLAEGTPVKVTLLESLMSGQGKPGDEVLYELREDLYGPNHELLAAKGTHALGAIITTKKASLLGGSGKLEISCDYTTAVDGTRIPLRSELKKRGKEQRAGAVLPVGPGIGAFYVKLSKSVQVKEGTEFTVYVDQEVVVDPSKPAPAAAVNPATGGSYYVTISPQAFQSLPQRVASALRLGPSDKVTIAVSEFQLSNAEGAVQMDRAVSRDACGNAAAALENMKGFTVVRSDQWESAVKELKLDTSKPLDEAAAREVARKVNAKYVLVGVLTNRPNVVGVEARLLDVASGSAVCTIITDAAKVR